MARSIAATEYYPASTLKSMQTGKNMSQVPTTSAAGRSLTQA